MDDLANYPDEVLLRNYLLGKLPDASMDSIERHLAICDSCAERSHQLQPRDELVELVTAASSLGEFEFLADDRTAIGASHREAQTESGLDSFSAITCVDEESPSVPQLPDQSRYRIIRFLGAGGMGQVWLAEHQVLGRNVALKMLRTNYLRKGTATDRFDREMKAAAKLHHPNIAAVYDAEHLGDFHFLVMEYVEGQTLSEILRLGPMPIADACRAIRDAACGLAHAHKARLIHRDIKPGNMIRTSSGEVKLLDFGLVVSPEDAVSLTGPNLVMGTPDYISPEQAEDPHAADERSDIYSLGCTLYHLLAGRVPYTVSSTVRKIDAHRRGELTSIPSMPPTLMSIVKRMMARNPTERFQSATEVVAALEPFVMPGAARLKHSTQTDANHDFKLVRTEHRVGFRRAGLLLAGVGLLMLCINANRNRYVDRELNKPAEAVVKSGSSSDVQVYSMQVHKNFKQRLVGHTGLVRYALFSPDSSQLFSCGDDGMVCIWDVHSGELLGKLDHGDSHGHRVRLMGLALAEHGNKLVASQDDRLRLWSVGLQAEIPGAFDSVAPDELQHISSNHDGTLVAAGSVSGNIRVWEISSRKLICESPALSADSNYSAAWIPGQSELLVADGEHLEILDVCSGERRILFTNTGRFCNAVVSPDGNTLAGASFTTEITLLNGGTGECRGEFWSGAVRIQFLPDGRLVTGCHQTTDIWDSAGKTKLATMLGEPADAVPLAVSPDGRFIASGGDKHSVIIWNVPDTPMPDR